MTQKWAFKCIEETCNLAKGNTVSIYIQIFAKRNRPYIKTFSQLAIMKYFLSNAGLTNVSASEASFDFNVIETRRHAESLDRRWSHSLNYIAEMFYPNIIFSSENCEHTFFDTLHSMYRIRFFIIEI